MAETTITGLPNAATLTGAERVPMDQGGTTVDATTAAIAGLAPQGTVTSVGLVAPTGFSVSGSPVTAAGNITLTFAAGYSLPTDARQADWDAAFTQRRTWDGGDQHLNAATGRASLGLGTAAQKDTGTAAGNVPVLDSSGLVPLALLPGSGGATNIWIPAAQWIPATTNGCGINSLETSTNRINYDVLEFDSVTSEQADCIIILPNNWSYGTVTARFYWTAASGSGGVVFQLAGLAYGDNVALDTALGTAQSVADTLQTANNVHVTAATAAITIAGTPAANKPVQFQIKRLPADASDTLAVDARLLGVEVLF